MAGKERGRRKKGGGEEGEGGMERWLLTYADMITLLMAFFVMMWSMSLADKTKFTQMIGSARAAMGMDVTGLYLPPLPTQQPTSGSPAILAYDIRGVLNEKLGGTAARKDVQVLSDEDSVTIRMYTGKILFGRGRAKLTGAARAVLAEIAKVLRQVPCRLRVEGHTCDLPLRGGPFASNWELSTQRATNVVLYFVRAQKLPPERFAAIGYADTRPAVPNKNEANRQKNRRVDIKLMELTNPPRLLMKPVPAPAPSAARPTVLAPVKPRPKPRRAAEPIEQETRIELESGAPRIVAPVDILSPVDIRSYYELPAQKEK